MRNPLSWDYLTAPVYDTPVWGPFSIAYVVLFGLGFLTAIAMYIDVGRRHHGNRLLIETVRNGAAIAMAVFGIGLLFFLFRFLGVSAWNLHMRIWLYLSALAAVAMLAYFWYYVRNVYRPRVAQLAAEREKRKYLVRAVAGGSSGTVKPRQAGARSRKGAKQKRT